jgi:hypothetical protein
MRWEKIGKDYVSGPWLIRRFGYGFVLTNNGKDQSKHPTIAAAKLAAEGLQRSK